MYYRPSYVVTGAVNAALVVLGALAVVVAVGRPHPAAAEASGDAGAGQDVYSANCAMCHGPDATGMMGMHPALRGAVDRLTAEGVEVTIRNGRQTTPPMPAFGDRLSDEQITDVITYLDTLPSGPRNFGPEMTEPGAMMRDDDGMMDGMMNRGWDGGDVLLTVVLVVLVAVLIVAVVLVVNQRRSQPAGDGGRAKGSPRDILDRRYAAGELSREQYRQARDDLDH